MTNGEQKTTPVNPEIKYDFQPFDTPSITRTRLDEARQIDKEITAICQALDCSEQRAVEIIHLLNEREHQRKQIRIDKALAERDIFR